MNATAAIPLSTLRDFHGSSIPASAEDIEMLARTIAGEASNEIFTGKVAVGWTVRNRVVTDLWGDKKRDWWGEGITAVCLRAWQYTCWWDHNADRIKRLQLGDAGFQDCMLAALVVIKGMFPDPTFGATHYFNPHVVKAPAWSIGRTPVCRIGNHDFYAGIEPGDPRFLTR